MKISNTSVSNINNQKITKSSVLSKQDFSTSLNDAYKSDKKEDLDSFIAKIKETGIMLTSTQSYSDIANYKKLIKDYLKEVVEKAYSLNKNTALWERQYFTTVETINEKLEDLTRGILFQEKSNIEIASSIDSIQGLLLDVYI